MAKQVEQKVEVVEAKPEVKPAPDLSNFSDEELTELLSQEGQDVHRAEAACCEVLANVWTKVASLTAGARKEDFNHVSTFFAKRAEALRAQYGGAFVTVSAAF